MPITWQENLATGIAVIDEQHREIFNRFNSFSDACEDGKAEAELSRLYEFLQHYTLEHFQQEENEMHAKNYPQLAEHCAVHATFADEICKLREHITGRAGMETVLLTKRILVQWLIGHIRSMDRELAQFLMDAAVSSS